jgi:REase_DpnII-MboI
MEREQDRTALWLTVIEALIHESRGRRAPMLADLVRHLQNVPHALKRWRWEERGRRGAAPSRWLIDDERDVQALLWVVLAPVYGADLVDEQHLPGWGGVQPRCDLGIPSLRTIIEVKLLRSPADFRAVEEGIAADAGLYFRESGRFERMIVFIYDDSDRSQPERYATLTAALKQRDQVSDVVIVRRPSMLPDQQART